MNDERPGDAMARARVPVREGLFTGTLAHLSDLRLAGSKCSSCGETALGVKDLCPNCGQASVEATALSSRGVLWTFTVVRHRPPGNYRGCQPFAPFALGLIELPDGVRVLSVIDCRLEDLRVGMPLLFKPILRHDDAADVVIFAFEPLEVGAVLG